MYALLIKIYCHLNSLQAVTKIYDVFLLVLYPTLYYTLSLIKHTVQIVLAVS